MPNAYTEEELRNIVISIRKSLKESKRASSSGTCLICGKKVTSFCKSHTLPRYILDNISDNGYVYTVNPKHNPLITMAAKEKIGIGDTNVFYDICRECDDEIFKEYETPENWNSFVKLDDAKKQRLLNLIFLKNACREAYIDLGGADFYKKMEKLPEQLRIDEIFDTTSQQTVEELDLKDHLANVEISLKALKEKISIYDILYFRKVHYRLPLATQCTFVPHFDLKDQVINDIYDMKATMRYLSVCIFPLEESSIIILFSLKEDAKYLKKLIDGFLGLSEREKGKCLIALVLGHTSEQLFFNKYSYKKVTNLPIAQQLSAMNITGYKQDEFGNLVVNGTERVKLDRFKELPDLFTKKN